MSGKICGNSSESTTVPSLTPTAGAPLAPSASTAPTPSARLPREHTASTYYNNAYRNDIYSISTSAVSPMKTNEEMIPPSYEEALENLEENTHEVTVFPPRHR